MLQYEKVKKTTQQSAHYAEEWRKIAPAERFKRCFRQTRDKNQDQLLSTMLFGILQHVQSGPKK